MAEEAFALSPMSARAARPSEADYAAISEAFMETSRGRWFLGEYAKRNRNADTRMVLDAVTRIEENIAAQRQSTVETIRDEQLQQVLEALRGTVEAIQAASLAALDELSFEPRLTPLRKSVRVIREISWRLREIGNDGRICDIMDAQASTIEATAAELTMDDAKTVVDTAFATLVRRLTGLSEEVAAPAADETPVAETTAAPAASIETTPSAESLAEPVEPVSPQPDPAALAAAEAALAEAEAAELAQAAEAAADAQDEAVLDLIAMEMGAPDPIDDDELMIVETPAAAAPVIPEPAVAVHSAPQVEDKTPAPAAMPSTPPAAPPAAAPASLQAALARAATQPHAEGSLGSNLIASGLIKKPANAANDPLAPIRRMSQAEKVALFS